MQYIPRIIRILLSHTKPFQFPCLRPLDAFRPPAACPCIPAGDSWMTITALGRGFVHWILLVIEVDKCRVRVYDSLRKPTYYYQDLINIMQRAWARFIKKHIGIASTPCELEFNTIFLVQHEYRRSTVISLNNMNIS